MKIRNFMSIDYQYLKQNNLRNKNSLKKTYQDFFPQKKYLKGVNTNIKKKNLKIKI